MNTKIATRLSTFSSAKHDQLDVEVQTNDFGANNQGGIHLWDKSGKYVDVPLTWEKKAGSDDVFVGHIAVPQGLDASSLEATAYVDIPQGNGSNYRIWEQADHFVEDRGVDRLRNFIYPDEVNPNPNFRTAQTSAGRLEIGMSGDDQFDYPDETGETGVTALRFHDDTGKYAGRDEIQVLLMPQIHGTDVDHGSSDWTPTSNDFMDYNESNLVTLKRQPDGSFAATAPKGQAFLRENTNTIYEGGSRSLSQIQFAMLDPQTNTWDSNNGANYTL